MPNKSIIIRIISALILPIFAVSNAAADDSFWVFHIPDDTKPNEYCVKDGIIFGTTKCIPKTDAANLGFDKGKILNLPSDPSLVTQMAKAQKEVIAVEKTHSALARDLGIFKQKNRKCARKIGKEWA